MQFRYIWDTFLLNSKIDYGNRMTETTTEHPVENELHFISLQKAKNSCKINNRH